MAGETTPGGAPAQGGATPKTSASATPTPTTVTVAGGPAGARSAARPAAATPVRIDTDGQGYPYRRGEILALDLDPAGVERMHELGYSVVSSERLDGAGSTLIILRGPTDGANVLDQLRKAAPGSTVGLNHVFDPAGANIPAQEVGGPVRVHGRPCDCRIGMVDTGVDPALPAAHLVQRGFGGGETRPQAHGDAVASLILDQISDEHGLAPGAALYVADIFAPGPQSGSAASLIGGLSWLAQSGASVINVSLTGPPNPVVAKVIEQIAARGVLVVAAAGNDGPAAPPVFPAAYPQVVAVTAVDAARRPYRYANRGPYVMFSALGVDVRTAGPAGARQTVSGTSFASPIVAVELARRLPAPDAAAARKALQAVAAKAVDLGAPGRDPVFGFGLIEPAR